MWTRLLFSIIPCTWKVGLGSHKEIPGLTFYNLFSCSIILTIFSCFYHNWGIYWLPPLDRPLNLIVQFLNYKYLFFHSFYGSRIHVSLTWMPRVCHKAEIKVSVEAVVISRLNWMRIHSRVHLHNCWQALGPSLLLTRDITFLKHSPFHKAIHNMATCLPRVGAIGVSKREATLFL